jgi:hypothetical protein
VPKAAVELGEWTSEHDDLLLKLKDTLDKRWFDIVALMERPKRLLVQRYGELKASQEPRVPAITKLTANITEATDPGDSTARQLVELDDDNWSATDPTDYINDATADPPVLPIEGQELNLREVCISSRAIWRG